MLKCQFRNTESWKEELQEGLKRAEIGPKTRALVMHIIKCYATDTDYNISSDYDNLAQAFCIDQHTLGWKHFLQGKLLPDWLDIINNEREQLGLPPNLRAVPQMMMALITTTLNLWRNRCEFMHGEVTVKKMLSNGEYYSNRSKISKHADKTSAVEAGIIYPVPPPKLHNFGSFGHEFGQHRPRIT